MTEVDITVAVCTRDNCRQLADLLGSLATLRPPAGVTWELVLVNNASIDATAQTIAEWQGRLPMRLVDEPRGGLSYARNAAVDAARGRYICWTDDDVIVPPDWLEILWRAFLSHPEAAVFGGRIEPHVPEGSPRWFAERIRQWPLSSVTAFRDLGPAEIPLLPRADALPWGANMALRAEDQKRLRYDPALNWGDETDVTGQLLAGGATGWWIPESRVTHIIRPERQTHAYVARYFRRAGWTAAYLGRRNHEGPPNMTGADGWIGSPGWLLSALALGSRVAAGLARTAGRTDSELRHFVRRHYMHGILDYRAGSPG